MPLRKKHVPSCRCCNVGVPPPPPPPPACCNGDCPEEMLVTMSNWTYLERPGYPTVPDEYHIFLDMTFCNGTFTFSQCNPAGCYCWWHCVFQNIPSEVTDPDGNTDFIDIEFTFILRDNYGYSYWVNDSPGITMAGSSNRFMKIDPQDQACTIDGDDRYEGINPPGGFDWWSLPTANECSFDFHAYWESTNFTMGCSSHAGTSLGNIGFRRRTGTTWSAYTPPSTPTFSVTAV